MGSEHRQQWTLQLLQHLLDGGKGLDVITTSTFDLWVRTIADYELVLCQKCPESMFEDLRCFLKIFREKVLPRQLTLALTGDISAADQEEKLHHLCTAFNRRLQNEVAKSLRSECKIVLPQINRWLTILRKVKPSLRTEETQYVAKTFLTFRRFCERKIILEAVPPSEAVTFLEHYQQFCLTKADLKNAIEFSPLPIGSHYPYVVDLSIILTQARSPPLLSCTRSEMLVPKECDFRRELTANVYKLSAEIVYYGVRDLVRAFRKPVLDGLNNTVYVRHLYKIANKLQERKLKLKRFLDHCQNMVKNIKKGNIEPSKDICRDSQEAMKKAQLLVKDTSFKVRVYVRRRLMKLYDDVLKDMKRFEKSAEKVHRQLAIPLKNKAATLLADIRRTRKFWKNFLDVILQELYENKSLKLVMNLQNNYCYFSKMVVRCHALKNGET